MIVLIAENVEMEVGGVGDIYEVVMTEETIWGNGPVWFRMSCMGRIDGVGQKSGEDVETELILVHDNGGP